LSAGKKESRVSSVVDSELQVFVRNKKAALVIFVAKRLEWAIWDSNRGRQMMSDTEGDFLYLNNQDIQ